jgi:hypothetical protein
VVLVSMLGPLGFPFEKVSGSAFRAALVRQAKLDASCRVQVPVR